MAPGCCRLKFTPLAIQILSMAASLFCVVYSILHFISFSLPRLAINLYILLTGVLCFIADIRCFSFFGYIKFLYTPIGRGLVFLLIGCVMLERGIFNFISGLVLIGVGVIYFIAARLFGGVPKPLLQKDVEDLPLATDLRFVGLSEEPPVTSARTAGTQRGFRV